MSEPIYLDEGENADWTKQTQDVMTPGTKKPEDDTIEEQPKP